MSDTPETQEAIERWRQGKINIFDEMARLETERNNLEDQRDFAMSEISYIMSEIKRLRKERDEARQAFATATNHAIEAREMLRRIMDWSPCLPDYERDAQHLKWQSDAHAARKFLEAAK